MKDFKKYIPWAIVGLLFISVVIFLYLNRNPAIDNKKITVPEKEPKKTGGGGGGSSQSSGQQGPPPSVPTITAPVVGNTIVAKYDGVKAYKSIADSNIEGGYGTSTTVDHIAKSNEYLGSVQLLKNGMYLVMTASGKRLWVSATGAKKI